MSEKSNTKVSNNGVNETGSSSESLSPGRCPMERANVPSRQSVTARRIWSTQDNHTLMKFYYQSQPDKRGYRKRLLSIWNKNKMFAATEQRLCDQVRIIMKRGWFSELQLEEVRRTATENEIKTNNSEIKHQAQESSEHDNEGNQDKSKESDPQIKNKNTSEIPVPDKPNRIDEGRNDILEELIRLMKEDELPKPLTLRILTEHE